MNYTLNDFIETFRDYSNACAERGYTKLEYSIWREIKNCLKQKHTEIQIEGLGISWKACEIQTL